MQTVFVNVGQGLVTCRKDTVLAINGLGSCVAVALHDPVAGCGCLCHVVLPSSDIGRPGDPPSKFADTCLDWALGELARQGARAPRLRAKIAGGANLFAARFLAIGERNVQAVKAALARAGIPLLASDVGGTSGRTVLFHLADGRLEVRRVGQPTVVL